MSIICLNSAECLTPNGVRVKSTFHVMARQVFSLLYLASFLALLHMHPTSLPYRHALKHSIAPHFSTYCFLKTQLELHLFQKPSSTTIATFLIFFPVSKLS